MQQRRRRLAAMVLAYVVVFLLHLSASTCHATGRNQHLFFAGRAATDTDATAPLPLPVPATMTIHHHRHRYTTAKVVLSDDYNLHYHPAMTVARREGPPPPPSLLSGVEPSDAIEGAPPPPGKQEQDTSGAAMEPSPSLPSSSSPARGDGASSSEGAESGTEQEPASNDDVGVDYEGPKTHPPSHN